MKDDKVDAYIQNAPANQQKILRALRKLIHEAVPNASEDIKWGQPVFSSSADFAYLKSNKNHINLGFFNFSEFDDPNNLLAGTGKRMRHVKIHSSSDIKPEVFKKWFKTAAKK